MSLAGSGWRRLPGPLRSDDVALSRETVFEVLRNKRRRYALHHLKQEEERVEIGTLAEQVAAWEYDTGIEELSSQQRQRVYVSLVQSHLQMMAEKGVVSVDDDGGTVGLTEEAASLDVYLDVVPDNDIRWGQYYAGVASLNALILGVGALDPLFLAQAPDALWTMAIAVVFLLAALVHHWYLGRTRLGIEGPPSN